MKKQTSAKLNKNPMRFITLLAFLLFFSYCLNAQPPAKKIDFLNEGDFIPTFSIPLENGDTITSSSLSGNTVVLVFFATWCPPCLKELPHIQKKIWDEFGANQKFKLFAVGREHTAEELFAFKQKNNYTFPIIADTYRSIFKVFASQNIPRMYLIDKSGKIITLTSGFNESSFNLFIEKLREELKN